MKLDELPHDCENVLLVTSDEIVAADAWKFQSKLLAHLDCFSAVDTLLVGVVGLLVDYLPVDGARLELVEDLKYYQAIAHVIIEIVNIDVLDVETVDPEAEGTLLSAAFDIIVNDAKLLESFLFLLVELL